LTQEKNNRESARIRPTGERIGFASPHLNTAGLIAPPVHPSSGPFGQILSPPQRLLLLVCLLLLCRDCQ